MNAASAGLVFAGMTKRRQHETIAGHAFIERVVKGKRVYTFPERDEYDEAQRLLAVKYHGEVAAVEYFKDGGIWRPWNITTRKRIGEGPYAGRWSANQFDANWSKMNGSLYVHCSGGGGEPTVHITTFCRPSPPPCRIWVAPDIDVKVGPRKAKATAARLLACGYIRIDGPVPAPFADTMDGDTFWCPVCKDHLPRDEGQAQQCGLCFEDHHVHEGVTVLVAGGEVEHDEAGEPEPGREHGLVPGAYRIKHFPYYADGMIEGYLIESSLERIGDVPAGVDFLGYPCTHLCDECSKKTLSSKTQPTRSVAAGASA